MTTDSPDVVARLRELNAKTQGGPVFVEHAATADGLSRIDDGRQCGMHPIYGEAHDIAFAAACMNYVRRHVLGEWHD